MIRYTVRHIEYVAELPCAPAWLLYYYDASSPTASSPTPARGPALVVATAARTPATSQQPWWVGDGWGCQERCHVPLMGSGGGGGALEDVWLAER